MARTSLEDTKIRYQNVERSLQEESEKELEETDLEVFQLKEIKKFFTIFNYLRKSFRVRKNLN